MCEWNGGMVQLWGWNGVGKNVVIFFFVSEIVVAAVVMVR